MAHNQPNVQLYSYDNAELLLDAQTLRISVKKDKYNISDDKIQLETPYYQKKVSFITGLFAIGTDSVIFSSNKVARSFKLNGNLNIAEENTTNRKHLILSQTSVSNMKKIKSKIAKLNHSLGIWWF